MNRNDGLTEDEGTVQDALVLAVNTFARLPRQHPDELGEFISSIHRCQDLLAVRIVQRIYPEGWPIK